MLHPLARCLPGPGSFASMSDSLDSDASLRPRVHLLTLLHCATASSCSSCAGRIPPLPVPHSPGLRCALPPEGASSCPGPTLGAGSPHPLAPSSLTPLWAQCVPRRSEQSSPAGRDRLTFLTSDPSDPLSSTTLSHQLETTHQTSFLWAPFAGLCCFAVTAHIAKEQSSLNM